MAYGKKCKAGKKNKDSMNKKMEKMSPRKAIAMKGMKKGKK